jgi:hypothetical protein
MKKYCGNCKHRIEGTDSHMVCGIRDYVCRVSVSDKCKNFKSLVEEEIIIPKKFITEFAQLIMIGTEQANEDAQHTWLSKKEEQALKFAEKLIKHYA